MSLRSKALALPRGDKLCVAWIDHMTYIRARVSTRVQKLITELNYAERSAVSKSNMLGHALQQGYKLRLTIQMERQQCKQQIKAKNLSVGLRQPHHLLKDVCEHILHVLSSNRQMTGPVRLSPSETESGWRSTSNRCSFA